MTVRITDVNVLDNPCPFTSKFKFEITLDCLEPGIKDDLEWKLVYVGSASDESKDQELDDVYVGPISIGKNRFVFEAPPPNPKLIKQEDLLDVTVVLLSCSYKSQEFIRIGYYVNNEYSNNNNNNNNNTDNTNNNNNNNNNLIDPKLITRTILHDKPRVTRFPITWDENPNNKNQQIEPENEENKENKSNNNTNDNNNNMNNNINNNINNNMNSNNDNQMMVDDDDIEMIN